MLVLPLLGWNVTILVFYWEYIEQFMFIEKQFFVELFPIVFVNPNLEKEWKTNVLTQVAMSSFENIKVFDLIWFEIFLPMLNSVLINHEHTDWGFQHKHFSKVNTIYLEWMHSQRVSKCNLFLCFISIKL